MLKLDIPTAKGIFLLNKVKRAFHILRTKGIGTVALILLADARIYRRFWLLERSLQEVIPEAKARIDVSIEVLPPECHEEYATFYDQNIPPKHLERWQRGDTCFAARHDGEIVSTCWATARPVWSYYLKCEIPCRPGDVYTFDAYTPAGYRGLSIAPAVSLHVLRHYQEAGFRRVFRATLPENDSALRAHAKAGYRPFATLGYMLMGFRRRYFQESIEVSPWPPASCRSDALGE